MAFVFGLFGFDAAIRGVRDISRAVEVGGRRGMQRTVAGGASIVRAKASGRPGPRVITGDYRRSISGDIIEAGPTSVTGQIGSNAAQARRLEFGFFGPDSLGRRYNQPPFPHFTPAVGEIAELAVQQITTTIAEELNR